LTQRPETQPAVVEPPITPAEYTVVPIRGIPEGDVEHIVVQIDESTVLNYISGLVSFGPRVTTSQACADAGDWIYNRFENMGLQTRYHYWESGSYHGNNIEATLPGENSDEIVLVCGHYDTVSGSPGADDNAAGTAAVLAAAEIMSNYKFNYTVKFVAFDGEEQGLYGASYYVQEAVSNGDQIIAALNADMIGFAVTADDASKVKVYSDGPSHWIVDYTTQTNAIYDEFLGLQVLDVGPASNSDHYRFWQYGYNAVMYHEYNFNDYYHSSQDTIANMDINYDMRVTRLIVATLAELADYVPDENGGSLLPIVTIEKPIYYEIVKNTIEISGYAYDINGGEIRYVYVQVGDEEWERATGTEEWNYFYDTTKVEDGELIISAVSIDSSGQQSGVDNVIVIVENQPPKPPKIPDLDVTGNLGWTDVEPGETVTGFIAIKNVGDDESLLNWSITEYPNWGTWTFNPANGVNLKPSDGEQVVEVSVIAPDEEETTFNGTIKVVNDDDINDYEIIDFSLITPKTKDYPLFEWFIQRFPIIAKLFEILI
jgi:hypothetical protein